MRASATLLSLLLAFLATVAAPSPATALDPLGAVIEFGASELQDFARAQYEDASNPLMRVVWGAVEMGAIGAPAIYEVVDLVTPEPSDLGDAVHAVDNAVDAVEELARHADDVAQGTDDVPVPAPRETPTPTATPDEPPVNGGGGGQPPPGGGGEPGGGGGGGDAPGEYLAGDAPMQVTPGTTTLEGQHVNERGRVEPWRAIYDEYGRQIGRTDFNAGNGTEGIPDTHWHWREYGPGYSWKGAEVLRHIPGECPIGGE